MMASSSDEPKSEMNDYITCPKCGYCIFSGGRMSSSGYSHTTSYHHRYGLRPSSVTEAKPTKLSKMFAEWNQVYGGGEIGEEMKHRYLQQVSQFALFKSGSWFFKRLMFWKKKEA